MVELEYLEWSNNNLVRIVTWCLFVLMCRSKVNKSKEKTLNFSIDNLLWNHFLLKCILIQIREILCSKFVYSYNYYIIDMICCLYQYSTIGK